MQQFLRLCLWQAILFTIFTTPTVTAAEGGMSIKGPKSSDAVKSSGMSIRGPKSLDNKTQSSDFSQYEQYGPITSKDTLWNIALTVRPDNSLSVYQVMQSIY